MAGRIQLSPGEKTLLEDISIFPGGALSFPGSRPYTALSHAGSGFKGVVWQVADEYGKKYAAKITLPEDYEDKSHHTEVFLRQELPSPLFTRCVDSGFWRPAGFDRDFVVTVEEWVLDGVTFEKFATRPFKFSTSTICGFAEQVCRALEALEVQSLSHDDFHSGNLMIRPALPGEPQFHKGHDAFQVVVVDTGSLKPRDRIKKPVNDVMHFAQHLAVLHNLVAKRSDVSTTDRRFLSSLRTIIRAMLDTDAARALTAAEEIRSEVAAAYDSSRQPPKQDARLSSPFDYISAEQINSDDLLIRLFAHTSWVDDVLGPNPILLTGPRGCGKSMLFRWLSLRAHAARPETAVPLEMLNMCGVYISCSSDLQNKLADYSDELAVEERRLEIVHYFNLLLCRELLHTLIAAQGHQSTRGLFGLDSEQQAAAVAELFSRRVAAPRTVAFSPSPLQQALEAVEEEMYRSHVRMRTGERAEGLTDRSTLGDLTSELVSILPILQRYRLTFLLDDFSSHRIPSPIQRLLTPVIWERRPSHSFKVSSEKGGYRQDYLEGLSADAMREFLEIDCGREFLDTKDRTKALQNRKFAIELLNNRLDAAGWVGDAETLLGEGPTLAALALSLCQEGSGSRPQYHGVGTVAHLCSGDIATLLQVYRTMFDGRKAGDPSIIPLARQDAAIRSVSRQQLEAIPFHRPLGRDMHSLASAFGNFVGRALREGRGTATQDGASEPLQIPRIEVDGFGAFADRTGLTVHELALIEELLRRAVFIDLGSGQSRRGKVETLRWHFRRILLPAFLAGLGKNEAIKWHDPSKFRWFLEDPIMALDAQLLARSVSASRSGGAQAPLDGYDLWSAAGEEERQ